MDIAALSTMMAQSSLATQVGTSVLNLSKDVMQQQGQGLQKLMASSSVAMERSINPSVGGSIDIKL